MYTIYGNHAWKGKGREGKGEKKEGYKIERKNNGGGKEGEGQGFDKDYKCGKGKQYTLPFNNIKTVGKNIKQGVGRGRMAMVKNSAEEGEAIYPSDEE